MIPVELGPGHAAGDSERGWQVIAITTEQDAILCGMACSRPALRALLGEALTELARGGRKGRGR